MVWDSYPPYWANPRGKELIEAMWTEFGVTVVILLARLYTRAIVVKKFLWDDFWIFLGFFTNLVGLIFNQFAVNNGFGMHADQLDSHYAMEADKWANLAQPVGIWASCFIRLAYIVTLLNLLGPLQRSHRWVLRVFFVLQCAINAATGLYIYLQCRPLAGLWNHSIDAYCEPPYIQRDIGFSQGSFNAFTDLSLAIMPATIFWKLNIKRSMKISLTLSMSLGVFACVTAVIKTVYLNEIGSSPGDEIYEMWALQFWYCLENCTLIVAATIPVLRPLFRLKRRPDSAHIPAAGHSDHSWLRSARRRSTRRNTQQNDHVWQTWMNHLAWKKENGSTSSNDDTSNRDEQPTETSFIEASMMERPAPEAQFTQMPPVRPPPTAMVHPEQPASEVWPERGG